MSKIKKNFESNFGRLCVLVWYISQTKSNKVLLAKLTGSTLVSIPFQIKTLKEIGVRINFVGARKNGYYEIDDWGPINPKWVHKNIEQLIGQER
jgi:hypothetical protein